MYDLLSLTVTPHCHPSLSPLTHLQHQDQKDLPGYISNVHRTTRTLVTQLKGKELHGFTRKV